MEVVLLIIIVLLILIYYRLGLISDKLNVGIEQGERERQTRILEDISGKLDDVAGYLEDIKRNTDADYQKERDENRKLT